MYALGGERSDENRPQGEVVMPTPTTSAANGAWDGGEGTGNLQSVVALLPTPTTSDAGRGTVHQRDGRRGERMSSIGMLLPTPSASVVNDGESTETWLARRERLKATGVNGNGMGMPLTIASQLLADGGRTAPPSSDGRAA